MTPLRNIIAVKPYPSDVLSEGGIEVPMCFRERSSKALVIAAGKKSKLNVGDTIIHIKGAGDHVIVDGDDIFLMPDNEVLGYIEN